MSEPSNPQSIATGLNQRLQALQQFNLRVRQNLEAAELLLPELSATIDHLAAVGIAEHLLLTAGVVWQQRYEPGKGPSDSAQVNLAALKIPGGIGALVLDTNELLVIERENPRDPVWPARFFVPFADCPTCAKASLLPRTARTKILIFGPS